MSKRTHVQHLQIHSQQFSTDTTTSSGSFEAPFPTGTRFVGLTGTTSSSFGVDGDGRDPQSESTDSLRLKRRRLLMSRSRYLAGPEAGLYPPDLHPPSTSTSTSSNSSLPPVTPGVVDVRKHEASRRVSGNPQLNIAAVTGSSGPTSGDHGRLPRRQSTVSISIVGNVSVPRRSLTSFSSLQAPPASSTFSGVEQKMEQDTLPRKAVAQRRVSFGEVEVYRFQRAQGFDTIPSSGAISIGMEDKHFQSECFRATVERTRQPAASRTDTSENLSIHDQTGCSGEESLDESMEPRAYPPDSSLLQPLTGKTRASILKEAGVRIDKAMREEYKAIAESRLDCGCKCTAGECNDNRCSCFESGVNCQVERPSFPCACTKNECRNPQGRVEFSEAKAHKHFVSTISRLKTMERDSEKTATPRENRGDLRKRNSVTTQYRSEMPQISISSTSFDVVQVERKENFAPDG